jgi:hypothetical protein
MSYLAARDQMIDAIQNQINERKAMLLENHKNIQQTAKENEFLIEIAKDYKQYNDYIKKQKEEQIKSYGIIYEYLDKIIADTNFNTNALKDIKYEQSLIFNNINNLKNELDSIID